MRISSINDIHSEVKEYLETAKRNEVGGHRALLQFLERIAFEENDGVFAVIFEDSNYGSSQIHEFKREDDYQAFREWLERATESSKAVLSQLSEDFPGEYRRTGILEPSRKESAEAENKEDPLTYRQRCGKGRTDGG